jgi:hypothetical protein
MFGNVIEGVWVPRPVRIKGPRKERPDYHSEKWSNLPRTYVETGRGSIEKDVTRDEWWVIATHHCERDKVDPKQDSCGPLVAITLDRYHGQAHDWMVDIGEDLPVPDTSGVVRDDIPW